MSSERSSELYTEKKSRRQTFVNVCRLTGSTVLRPNYRSHSRSQLWQTTSALRGSKADSSVAMLTAFTRLYEEWSHEPDKRHTPLLYSSNTLFFRHSLDKWSSVVVGLQQRKILKVGRGCRVGVASATMVTAVCWRSAVCCCTKGGLKIYFSVLLQPNASDFQNKSMFLLR